MLSLSKYEARRSRSRKPTPPRPYSQRLRRL